MLLMLDTQQLTIAVVVCALYIYIYNTAARIIYGDTMRRAHTVIFTTIIINFIH